MNKKLSDFKHYKTQKLIEIVYLDSGLFDKEIIPLAKIELDKRNLSDREIEKIISKIRRSLSPEFETEKEIKKNNKTKRYSFWHMILIVVTAPFTIFKGPLIGDNTWTLNHSGYALKHRQRIILLTSGCLLWGIFVLLYFIFK